MSFYRKPPRSRGFFATILCMMWLGGVLVGIGIEQSRVEAPGYTIEETFGWQQYGPNLERMSLPNGTKCLRFYDESITCDYTETRR